MQTSICHNLRILVRNSSRQLPQQPGVRRAVHYDRRNRLSNFWTPTRSKKQGIPSGDAREDGHDLLVRAGFLRQAHSGIFHLLPLGLRVQNKVEGLIDKHMQQIGASKVSLSSLSSEDLWAKSGRLVGRDSELFHLEDRKESKYLLAPTHEEEITTIVKNAVHSYKDLPLRLYQVSRKYRDEARPRQGLLRGREFVMKDLYTFDLTEREAMETYHAVSQAYRGFMDDLNIPYLVANADCGNMGGNYSHEYHFASRNGEDTIIKCSSCGHSVNEELFAGRYNPNVDDNSTATKSPSNPQVWRGQTVKVDQNPTRSVEIYLPAGPFELNMHAVKKLIPTLDTSASDVSKATIPSPAGCIILRDPRVSHGQVLECTQAQSTTIEEAPFLLSKAHENDPCPSCGAEALELHQAVEIGHTFHLGTRYSLPLEATVTDDNNSVISIEMGCHGIGVSRLVGAMASLLADDKGLNWPVAIAPFGVVLVGAGNTASTELENVYDELGKQLTGLQSDGNVLDMLIDDRERPLGWKLNDADLIGYPFIIVLGKAWQEQKAVELQCRRMNVKEKVKLVELGQRINLYSQKL